MTLDVGQLFANDHPPKTTDGSVNTNTWTEIWAAPGASTAIRVRRVVISGGFTAGWKFELGEGTTVRAVLRYSAGSLVFDFPGEGWLLAANTALQIRHQAGSAQNVATYSVGREESV